MIDSIFSVLALIDDFYWSYVGFTVVIVMGLFFSIRCNWFQFRTLFSLRKTLKDLKDPDDRHDHGTHPFKLYFASVGGMIGVGNIVAVISALMIGGPGALCWLWIAAFLGMIIKYSEIYLGVKYRVPTKHKKGFDGGPMYYLSDAFKSPFLKKFLPILVSLFLCIYSVEIYQFTVVVDTVSHVLPVERIWVVCFLLVISLWAGFGGVSRLANICTFIMPVFMISYTVMCLWVIIHHMAELPELLSLVFKSAFTGMAPLGGFAGSTMLLAAQQGISRAVYSGDIGIGYDSIIQAETRAKDPIKQAKLSVFGVFGDLVFSTMSMLVVLSTGILWSADGLKASEYVSTCLREFFPHVDIFMASFIFLAGWTTIIGYIVVGSKAARFIFPKHGLKFYFVYAMFALFSFSFIDQSKVYLIMTLSGGILILINVIGIYKLREKIRY